MEGMFLNCLKPESNLKPPIGDALELPGSLIFLAPASTKRSWLAIGCWPNQDIARLQERQARWIGVIWSPALCPTLGPWTPSWLSTQELNLPRPHCWKYQFSSRTDFEKTKLSLLAQNSRPCRDSRLHEAGLKANRINVCFLPCFCWLLVVLPLHIKLLLASKLQGYQLFNARDNRRQTSKHYQCAAKRDCWHACADGVGCNHSSRRN